MNTDSKINQQIVILCTINFLYCFGIYITLPVLALYFYENLSIPIAQVGFLLAIPPLVASLCGSVGALVSKKIGEVGCLIVSTICIVFAYSLFMLASGYMILLCLSIIIGLSRAFWQPIIKALLGYHGSKLPSKDVVFRINYIVICMGAIFGPATAILINSFARHYNLMISIFLFISIIVILFLSLKKIQVPERIVENKQSVTKIGELKKVDPRLLLYVLGGLLVFFVFSMFESVFSLALSEVAENPEMLFSILLLINSIAGVLLQLMMIYFFSKANGIYSILLGNAAFAAAFCIFAFSDGLLAVLIIATLFFTLGEVLAIPGSDIVIDDIAPPDKKTLYFGVAELRILGFSIGPAFFGFVLESTGFTAMFLSALLFVAMSCLTYLLPKTSIFADHVNGGEIHDKNS